MADQLPLWVGGSRGFLDSVVSDLVGGGWTLVELTVGDMVRVAELVRTYSDLKLDPADACVVALAERLDIRQVATLDRRDFSVVRPRHVDGLNLFP
ncbi:MAG: PIN domain-containing protein [Candidatus Dormibacteraceae bacterium]